MSALKIVFIMGDGRSGSTLLESILNNDPDAVGVGESFRFWERYYKNESLCACGRFLMDCPLWSSVASDLRNIYGDSDVDQLKNVIRQALLHRNFAKFHGSESDWNFLLRVVEAFYRSIALHSGKQIIIDSSKSPSWAKVLSHIPAFDVRVIHLERTLPFVASSWKKKIRLPEYVKSEVFMPVKSNSTIAKTWIKTKLQGRRIRKSLPYIFVTYEGLCSQLKPTTKILADFSSLDIDSGRLSYKDNHGIAGNPVRLSSNEIEIHPPGDARPSNLTYIEFLFFRTVDAIARLLFSGK